MKSEKDRRPSPVSSIRTILQRERTVKPAAHVWLAVTDHTAAVLSEAWPRTVVDPG